MRSDTDHLIARLLCCLKFLHGNVSGEGRDVLILRHPAASAEYLTANLIIHIGFLSRTAAASRSARPAALQLGRVISDAESVKIRILILSHCLIDFFDFTIQLMSVHSSNYALLYEVAFFKAML